MINEKMKWPSNKAKYDKNYLKIFGSVKWQSRQASHATGGKTMIRKCNCRSKHQDTKYGIGMRIHNRAKSRIKDKVAWTCTVCGIKKD